MPNRTKVVGAAEDEDVVIARDGQTVRVPLLLMDSMQRGVSTHTLINDGAGHRPGYAVVTDADRQRRSAVYEGYNQRLNDAWKKPSLVAAATVDKTSTRTVEAVDHYATYDRRMSERWKGAA